MPWSVALKADVSESDLAYIGTQFVFVNTNNFTIGQGTYHTVQTVTMPESVTGSTKIII